MADTIFDNIQPTERTVTLLHLDLNSSLSGIVLVTNISSIGEFWIFSAALPENTGWVTAA